MPAMSSELLFIINSLELISKQDSVMKHLSIPSSLVFTGCLCCLKIKALRGCRTLSAVSGAAGVAGVTGILVGSAQREDSVMTMLFRAWPDAGLSFHSMLPHPHFTPGPPVVYPALLLALQSQPAFCLQEETQEWLQDSFPLALLHPSSVNSTKPAPRLSPKDL